MESRTKQFITDITTYDWKRAFEENKDEIARANLGITLSGSLITAVVLFIMLIYQESIGYHKLAIPYLCSAPALMIFMQHSFVFLKRKRGLSFSLWLVYAFSAFIFVYDVFIHDYAGDFEVVNLLPLFLCLVVFPIMIVDLPFRKFLVQVLMSVTLICVLIYHFEMDSYFYMVTIGNVIILSLTSYLCGCYLLYQRLNAYSSLRQTKYMSNHDMATGLRNRGRFFADYEEIDKENQVRGLMIIDVNDFKHINDTYGHIVGDEAISYVADVLKQYHNPGVSTFYRYGGDEFIGLFTKETEKSPEEFAKEMQNHVDSQMFETSDGRQIPLTISVGACEQKDGDTPEDLIVRADAKMYENKQNLKNAGND